MSCFSNESEVKIFKNQKSFLDFVEKIEEETDKLTYFINGLIAVGIPNAPLLYREYCEDIEVVHHGYKTQVGNIDYNDPKNLECIEEGTGIMLVLPNTNKGIPYPTGDTAFSSICHRAGFDCSTMTRFEKKPNKLVLPVEEKAKWLTRAFELYNSECLVVILDGKIRAVLSKEYVYLEADKLLGIIEAQLKKDHPNFQFKEGQASYEYIYAEYELNNQMVQESLRLKLNSLGCDISSLKAGLRFSTSNVGYSKANAVIYYVIDGIKVPVGEGIHMAHKGDASLGKFDVRMTELGTSLKDSEDQIEKLGNTDISDVPGVLQKICDKFQFLPKKVSDMVIADAVKRYPLGGTAIDVYLLLCEIADKSMKGSSPSPTEYIELYENISKLIKLPFEKIDAGNWD